MSKLAKFYRYHPDTGQDAEDFSDVPGFDTSTNQKELADMKKHGATFWWTNYPEDGELHRVERINMEFIVKVTGAEAQWIDEKPIAT
jgi:hypothetical protein